MFTKKALLLLTASAALAIGATAQAQGISYSGANIEAEYFAVYNDDGTYSFDRTNIFGSVVIDLGSNFAVQADFGTMVYDGEFGFDHLSYGLHGAYRISPNFVAGAYFTRDSWQNGSSLADNYGIEAKYTPGALGGRLTLEGVIGAGFVVVGPFSFPGAKLATLGAQYSINDNIDISGRYTLGGWPDFNPGNRWDSLTVDATYNFDSGLYATASYRASYWDTGSDASFGVTVGFNFGNGSLFGRRSITSFYSDF